VSSVTDREALTPRESSTWEFQGAIATGLSRQIRDEELRLGQVSPGLDTARANMLRHLRQVVDYYGAAFAKGPSRPEEQRARDQAAFSALTALVRVTLEERT
jgi:hypothetical protein